MKNNMEIYEVLDSSIKKKSIPNLEATEISFSR